MGALIDDEDGLPVAEVGEWAKKKHTYLKRYIDISRHVRKKWLGPKKAGATFIDLFCGPGRARIKGTGELTDGSAIAAWKISQEGGAPFSGIYIADINESNRRASAERLRRSGAPVHELTGSAVDAAAQVTRIVNTAGLHFAFIDPFSLGALDFRIIQSLAKLKRIDMLIHVSKMDHQRNLNINIKADASALDLFIPGWRGRIDRNCSQQEVRRQIVEYWQELVRATGKRPSTDWELIKGSRGQHLYWLLLVAEHDLAHKFWNVATDNDQGSLF